MGCNRNGTDLWCGVYSRHRCGVTLSHRYFIRLGAAWKLPWFSSQDQPVLDLHSQSSCLTLCFQEGHSHPHYQWDHQRPRWFCHLLSVGLHGPSEIGWRLRSRCWGSWVGLRGLPWRTGDLSSCSSLADAFFFSWWPYWAPVSRCVTSLSHYVIYLSLVLSVWKRLFCADEWVSWHPQNWQSANNLQCCFLCCWIPRRPARCQVLLMNTWVISRSAISPADTPCISLVF